MKPKTPRFPLVRRLGHSALLHNIGKGAAIGAVMETGADMIAKLDVPSLTGLGTDVAAGSLTGAMLVLAIATGEAIASRNAARTNSRIWPEGRPAPERLVPQENLTEATPLDTTPVTPSWPDLRSELAQLLLLD